MPVRALGEMLHWLYGKNEDETFAKLAVKPRVVMCCETPPAARETACCTSETSDKDTTSGCGGCGDESPMACCADEDAPATPCGICRQVIVEFSDDAIIVCATPSARIVTSIAELLPHAFKLRP